VLPAADSLKANWKYNDYLLKDFTCWCCGTLYICILL